MTRSDSGIRMFLHCKKCLDEGTDGVSPAEYAQYEVGFTTPGLQVWCRRHNINIIHIDFEGQKHPTIQHPEPT